jgi:hypothetical protein
MRHLFCRKRLWRRLLAVALLLLVSTVQAEEVDLQAQYPDLKKKLLERYQGTIEKLAGAERAYEQRIDSVFSTDPEFQRDALPAGYQPWWTAEVRGEMGDPATAAPEDVEKLFVSALKYSSQIKTFSDLPLIRETTIQEAEGPYDFRLFAEGKYDNLNEPVGDILRTGGADRYKQYSRSIGAGIRKKFKLGTEVELKQSLEGIDTNSIYFTPEDQSWARTRLTLRQPLLRGAGVKYNESVIELARVDHSISEAELRRQVESHLLEISRAYWGLYLERSVLVQKKKLAEETEKIYRKMKERQGLDVLPSLLARARSQVVARQLGAVEAEYAMRNAADRIRALVNDPALVSAQGIEIVTHQMPRHDLESLQVDDALRTALENRPEVEQVIKQIQAAAIRLMRSDRETLPDLDFFFETYVIGLHGDYQYGTAYGRQFDTGKPSYSLGLRFEYPLGNNAAEARQLRKRLEVRQLLNQLDTTVQNVFLEVQVSFREMIKNYKEMVRRYQVMESTSEEIRALVERIDYLLVQDEAYGNVLYRLMDALDRMNEAEVAFARSELTYNLSLYNLNRVTGILVSVNNIRMTRDKEDDLPVIRLERE